MQESGEVVDERDPKRMFIDINGWAEPRMTAHLTEVGCARTVVSGFGGFATSASKLLAVKQLIKQGRAIWLNIRVGPYHRVNPK